MSSANRNRTPMGAKKPVPAAVKPQTNAKKPVPAPVKPQTGAKKPVPAPVRPQNARAPPKPNNSVAKSTPSRPAQSATKAPTVIPPSTNKAVPKAAPAASEAPKAGNWINRTVQGSVASVGNYAGGFVNSIGDSVNKVGEGIGASITNTTRYWGQGVAGYGNNIKDAVGVGGPRISTAGNPLGMAGQGSAQGALPGGKQANSGTRSTGGGTAGNPLGI